MLSQTVLVTQYSVHIDRGVWTTMDNLNFGQAVDLGTKSCRGGTMVAVYITKWPLR
jgi:hypothetical protein